MIRYVLDTDVLSLMLRRDPTVIEYLKSLPSYEEQIAGRFSQVRRARGSAEAISAYYWLQRTAELLAPIPLIGYTAETLNRFAGLLTLKLNVGSNDLRIAATALEIGAMVVARNRRDFSRVPGLTLAVWDAT